MPWFVRPFLLILLLSGGTGRLNGAGLGPAWEQIARSRSPEARLELKRSGLDGTREQRLAEAVYLLARPPVAEGKLPGLEATLVDLAQGDDEIAALAWYLRARLQQVHRLRPDYPQAAAIYRELAGRHPASHWAQLGLVKLGLLTLHALPEPADPAGRVAAAAALLEGIREPALRRDLHLQIGLAALDFERPLAEVLPHLMAAEAVGGLHGIVAEDLLIQIGELSLRSGQTGPGRDYLQKFLHTYPTNSRRYSVEQRLAGLEAGAGGGAGQ